jgi:hypothetical protein
VTVHDYPPARYRAAIVGQDVVLALALALAALAAPSSRLASALVVAIPAVLAWGLLTLHFPSRVEIDDRGIAFCRYGRAHRFAWADVDSVHVRRFLVGDRVLVRIVPAPAWRGRYWLLESLRGFDALVGALEARAGSANVTSASAPASPASAPPARPPR